MRRLLSVCSLLLLALAAPAATELVTAAPAAAATSPCKVGEVAHIKSKFSPNPTPPLGNVTNIVTIWNCTSQSQTVGFKGNVFGPANCPPGQDFGPFPVTLAPLQKFVNKVSFEAPSCLGTYTQNIQLFQGGTTLAHQRATFVVS